jgi:hypothetical protein
MAVIAAKARLYGMCMIENLRRDEHAKSAGSGNERRAFQEHFWQALVDSLVENYLAGDADDAGIDRGRVKT